MLACQPIFIHIMSIYLVRVGLFMLIRRVILKACYLPWIKSKAPNGGVHPLYMPRWRVYIQTNKPVPFCPYMTGVCLK